MCVVAYMDGVDTGVTAEAVEKKDTVLLPIHTSTATRRKPKT